MRGDIFCPGQQGKYINSTREVHPEIIPASIFHSNTFTRLSMTSTLYYCMTCYCLDRKAHRHSQVGVNWILGLVLIMLQWDGDKRLSPVLISRSLLDPPSTNLCPRVRRSSIHGPRFGIIVCVIHCPAWEQNSGPLSRGKPPAVEQRYRDYSLFDRVDVSLLSTLPFFLHSLRDIFATSSNNSHPH